MTQHDIEMMIRGFVFGVFITVAIASWFMYTRNARYKRVRRRECMRCQASGWSTPETRCTRCNGCGYTIHDADGELVRDE